MKTWKLKSEGYLAGEFRNDAGEIEKSDCKGP